MFKKTIKTVLFIAVCALALGMMARPYEKTQAASKKLVDYKKNTTCECAHVSINLIGECANIDCPYYYGTLDW